LRAPTPDTAAVGLPAWLFELPEWLPIPMQQHVRELWGQLGLPVPDGRGVALPEHLAILRRLVTTPAMRPVWRRLERHAKSESALVEFLDCVWQSAVLTPPIQTPGDRLTLVRLWRQEQESLRLTDPELAQHCVRVSVYFDQVERDLGVSNSPLLVKHHRKHHDDCARAFVCIVGARARELFDGEFLGSLVTIVEVALPHLTIDKSQAQRWLRRRPSNRIF